VLIYSLDPAPSDFFLFRTVKTKLQNYETHSRQDLILVIKAIFDEIPKDTLNSVYVLWIRGSSGWLRIRESISGSNWK
jgi:hypothetical protein